MANRYKKEKKSLDIFFEFKYIIFLREYTIFFFLRQIFVCVIFRFFRNERRIIFFKTGNRSEKRCLIL